MKISTKQVESVLMNRAISAYRLSKETGINKTSISFLRNGERPFENMTLATIMKVQKWIDEGNYTFGYDYSELLEEIQADVGEGLLGDEIYIVRGKYREEIDCNPIIDYYYSDDDIDEGVLAERAKTFEVISEMKKLNKII